MVWGSGPWVSVGSLKGDLLSCVLEDGVNWTLSHTFQTVRVCESDTQKLIPVPFLL